MYLIKIMSEEIENSSLFSQNEIDNFVAFSTMLKRIHTRLIGEGYTIKDGKISKIGGDKKAIECVKI